MKTKVTIGICVRNAASTLHEAIESVMAQDYPHELIEVIFVDDGSTDNTLSIIKDYASKMGIKVKIFHHEWKGLGYSRNVVVNNAEGKYIIWVDGDIIIPPKYVKTMVKFMENNSKVAIAGGAYELIKQENLVAFLDNILYVAYRHKSGTNLPGTGGAIYRVEAVKYIGGFDVSINGSCEDIDIAYRLKIAKWDIVRDIASFYSFGKKSWKEYWNHCVWHGYGAHYVKHKNRHIFSLPKMSPLLAFLAGVKYSMTAYKLAIQKKVFILPFFSLVRNIAWWVGFFKSHINGYGHISKMI